jgi:hypothetical protein
MKLGKKNQKVSSNFINERRRQLPDVVLMVPINTINSEDFYVIDYNSKC